MGNRAVITTKENFENNGVGVYLHWNGGRDSVEAFLKYCEIRDFRAPDDDNYGWARLVQVISNFFGMDGLSIGIDVLSHLDCDNGDNGVYIIKGWEIVGREYFNYEEQHSYEMNEMLHAIDKCQPEPLGDYLDAEEVDVSSLKVGDKVYVKKWDKSIHVVEVKGFGDDMFVGGVNVKGLPFIPLVNDDRHNRNNYITSKTVRKAV